MMEHIVKALNSEILHCIQKESWGQGIMGTGTTDSLLTNQHTCPYEPITFGK